MFIVISEDFVGEVTNLYEGPKTTKGHFPIMAESNFIKPVILNLYPVESLRREAFLAITSLVKQAPGKQIFIDFTTGVCHYI